MFPVLASRVLRASISNPPKFFPPITVSDDENSQAAAKDAFEVLHFIAAKRLAAGKLVVVDATNVQSESHKPLVELAREYHCLPMAIVLNMPELLTG